MAHPLHSAVFLENFKGNKNVGLRHTGRSTAQGLEIIARAIKRPNHQIIITDHHGTLAADQNLAYMVKVMVDKLGLDHMHVGTRIDGWPYLIFGDGK